jgi:hypothetical protein
MRALRPLRSQGGWGEAVVRRNAVADDGFARSALDADNLPSLGTRHHDLAATAIKVLKYLNRRS